MLSAFMDQMLRLTKGKLGQVDRKQHQVDGFTFENFTHVFTVFSEFRAHMHTGCAQRTGYVFGFVKALINDKQANQYFFVFHMLQQ